MTRSKLMILVLALLVVACQSGCSRGLKEAAYGITGSSGRPVYLSGNKSQVSGVTHKYGGFEYEPFTNDIGALCPPAFLAALPGALDEELRYRDRSLSETLTFKEKEELGYFLVGPIDKKLRISGRVIQYDTGTNIDKILGPMQEAVCRVQIYDAQSGNLLVEANCVARAKSSVRNGPQELAEGIAKAVKKMLEPDDD